MDLDNVKKDVFGFNISDTIISNNPNLASEFHYRLINWINDFHRALDADHEVGLQLVTFGEKTTFHVEDIGYWNPSLISFIGKTEKGDPVELVQHVSQISLLLVKMKNLYSGKPKNPIGFATWEEFDKQKK